MLASFTLSEDVESHSMQPPASEDARLCLPGGMVRGGEQTWGVREETWGVREETWAVREETWGEREVTWVRCRDLRGRVGDLSGLES